MSPTVPPPLQLSGLEPLLIAEDTLFVNVGERTNVTGSRPDSFIGGGEIVGVAVMRSPVLAVSQVSVVAGRGHNTAKPDGARPRCNAPWRSTDDSRRCLW